jgi:hypothetical protein
MLTVRKKNLAMLEEAIQGDMKPRLVKYILRRFYHVFEGDKKAAAGLVERACAAAEAYGITKDEEAAIFADLSVMYGEEFHRDEWAAEVLTSEALTPAQKIKELRARVRESGAIV